MSLECDNVIEYVEKVMLIKLIDEQKNMLRETVRCSAVNFVVNMHMNLYQPIKFPERE